MQLDSRYRAVAGITDSMNCGIGILPMPLLYV